MTNHGSIPLDSNFDFKFIVAWTCCSSISRWLHVASNQGRLLKPQTLLNFRKTFIFGRCIPLGISLISCSYTQPSCWLKDYYMLLKLGDVLKGLTSRTMIFCYQKHCALGSHLQWHILLCYSHFGGQKSPKKLFFKNRFL